ncbi:MAG: ferrous iron transporter B [Acetomicrobium sp.]|nr:ferrous iron transporter B [Acetomicrobium sp.]
MRMSCHGIFDILKKRKTDDRNNVNLDDFESNTGCGMGIHCSECPLSFRCSHDGNKDVSKTTKSGQKIKKILLMGNPNVGKSAIFSRLTGLHAISSNYPGTTVGFLEGSVSIDGETYKLIDVPGAYTLDPTNEAEEVARRILDEGGDIVVIVADATALERNLYLALQVLEKGYPSVLVLNMVDEARHKGIHIDLQTLEIELGIPVVSTVAVTGEGISALKAALAKARPSFILPMGKDERWRLIGDIVMRSQQVTHRHHTFRDRLEDISVHPVSGLILSLLVIGLSFYAIRTIGEGLIDYVFDPLFDRFWGPLLASLSNLLGGSGFLHDILIGHLIDGNLDWEQSFGILSTGLYVEFAMVFPYIISFYLILSLLEDIGYLPRLAVLFDALLHRIGLHGFAIVPTLLGLGCNVPGILATRVLESERERFIAATLISVAVPCAGLQAMIFGAIGSLGMRYVVVIYASLFLVWLILGYVLNKVLSGQSPELIVEIPPYRLPSFRDLGLKLWFRISGFLLEATPLVLIGILIANLIYSSGILPLISNFLKPAVYLLGLPSEAIGAILLGFLRKDVAVGLLLPLGLTPQQLIVATVVLSMTFPCIATFVVLFKELGTKRLLQSIIIMISIAMLAGIALNSLFSLMIT